jgi:glycosyltransferase involved in cell wall biosynthesis
MTATVSVLMPMRNAASYVEEALRSILVDDRVLLEVIVVDDGSSDGSRSIVEGLGDTRIRVVDGPREGIAAAFNTALEISSGGVIMRCDADDLFPPTRISGQVEWLRAHPEFGAICGAFTAMNARGRSRVPFQMARDASEITAELQNGKTRTHFGTFAVRADILREMGGARSFFVTGEDVDVQLRLGERCRVWYSPEVAYFYRLHDSSVTHTVRSHERDYFERQAQAFQLQRKRSGADDLQLGHPPPALSEHSDEVGSASEHLRELLIGKTWAAIDEGDRSGAIRFAFQAAFARPDTWRGWRNLLITLAKAPLPKRYWESRFER